MWRSTTPGRPNAASCTLPAGLPRPRRAAAGREGHQVAEKPPSTSPGWPLRPTMVRAASAALRAGSLATSLVSGVTTNPGDSELQHTPRGAHASDCDLVSEARPPLDAP